MKIYTDKELLENVKNQKELQKLLALLVFLAKNNQILQQYIDTSTSDRMKWIRVITEIVDNPDVPEEIKRSAGEILHSNPFHTQACGTRNLITETLWSLRDQAMILSGKVS